MSPEPRIFTWDHREQPPMEYIAAFVFDLSGGVIRMQEAETGSDRYAWTVSGRLLEPGEQQELLRRAENG